MTLTKHAPTDRARAPRHLVIGAPQLAQVQEILQQFVPGVEVRAFGSRARGHAKPASDLDLIAFSAKPLEPRCLALLADAFAESDLPFKVDVVDASTATPSFRTQALAESIVVQLAVHAERDRINPGEV